MPTRMHGLFLLNPGSFPKGRMSFGSEGISGEQQRSDRCPMTQPQGYAWPLRPPVTQPQGKGYGGWGWGAHVLLTCNGPEHGFGILSPRRIPVTTHWSLEAEVPLLERVEPSQVEMDQDNLIPENEPDDISKITPRLTHLITTRTRARNLFFLSQKPPAAHPPWSQQQIQQDSSFQQRGSRKPTLGLVSSW